MWAVDTDRVHAALHHSRLRYQARKTAGDVTLEDVNIRPVCLSVSVVRVCLTAHVVA